MGILDDAIREHLELKRQHGANEDDIRAKEAEAFGPVRQEVAEAPEEAAHPEDVHADDAHPAERHHEDVHAPAHPEDAHPEPAAEDPYAVHPGDHPVPDPHDHGEHEGKDPAWGKDTELFAEPSQVESQPAPLQHDEEHRRPFDTDEHLHEPLPPEPVYGHRAEAPPAEPPPVEEAPAPPPAEEPPAPEAHEGQAGEDDEDVLEETPEFLQDAPEHDRLWFEQKPPRDFDFGE
jgi:hypothetical protein